MSDVSHPGRGLTKWFGQGEAKMCAVREVSFEARTSTRCSTSSGRRAAGRRRY
jgi:hypothetical protein